MKKAYSFHPNLILRAPAFPFDVGFTERSLERYLSDPRFAEALYLASPNLYDESCKWIRGELSDPKKVAKLRSSLVKYYSRMTSRCTPFGLFAGCTTIGWGESTDIRLASSDPRRRTRLDMHYVCALAEQFSTMSEIKEKLQYFPNTSLYYLGDEIRYVEYRFVNQERAHQISSVPTCEHLLAVLEACENGATYTELVLLLTARAAVSAQIAVAFVEQIIENQIIVSELEPSVTGQEYIGQLTRVLERIASGTPIPLVEEALVRLREVHCQITKLDQTTANAVASYGRITEALSWLKAPMESGKLFQTDLIHVATQGTLDQEWQRDILEAIDVLGYLVPKPTNENLENFARQFYERYEDQEMPLLEVLDTESGIGYADHGKSSYSPLTEDLILANADTQEHLIRRSEVQQFMYQKLRDAERDGHYAMALSQEELRPFTKVNHSLPPSFSVVFRLVDQQRILLESVSGSSAANLLGRFAHADERISQTISEITAQEQACNPEVIFAEVCHLPASRVGNILLRPIFRPFEIPYLAKSTLSRDHQLLPQDLCVAVRKGRIILRSKRLNKGIVPRLGTAHNYAHQPTPVYQFLCDLQTQGLQTYVGFDWDSISPDSKFLPRLTYRRVILQAASWHLSRADFQELLEANVQNQSDCFERFQNKFRLPRFFTLADGDHELLVDSCNQLTIQAWLDTIRNRDRIRLKEFLFEPNQAPVTDGLGRPYVNQLIASLINAKPCYAEPPPLPFPSVSATQREFTLGSEWLYYKLYCGVKVADRMLLEVIKPLSELLLEQCLTDQWFFVRYADPKAHLRVRFHLRDPSCLGEVVQLANQYIQASIRSGALWKVQTDTYRRELERYGQHAIELSEKLFFYESRSTLAIIEQTQGDEQESVRWMWGMRLIDELLNAFDYSLGQKLPLLRGLKESFGWEFGVNKDLALQLDAKYRHHRKEISQVFAPASLNQADATFDGQLYSRYWQLRSVAQQLRTLQQQDKLEVGMDELMGSYIHMLMNRLITVDQRLHEMIVYDFLFRHYQSQLARQTKGVSQ